MSSDQGAAWKKGEARDSRIVFIGRHMPKDVILGGLEQCLVPPGKPAASMPGRLRPQ
jgi:G3E family GTPase